jgi:formate dehydrogenase subunit gamma
VSDAGGAWRGVSQKQVGTFLGRCSMARLFALIRTIAFELMLIVIIIAPAISPVSAQVNPNGSAVQEQQLLNKLKTIQGLGTIPDTKSYVLEHPAGRDWQYFHNVTLRWIAAVAILGFFVVLVLFYLVRGSVKLESGYSGRKIVRFNWFERFVHWMTAVCFVILGITGLNITFGRPLLLPIIGADSFTVWSEWAKYAHNFLSFPFTIGVVLIFLMWLAGNIPNRTDIEWLKEGGGIVGDRHPAADRFNAGQKVVYWVVVIGGAIVAITGYLLMFPFYGTTIDTMQRAEMVHGLATVLFIAFMLGHIYIGTIGMQGAFEAMGEGTVDVNWAREHHSQWLEKETGRTSSPSRAVPAE